MWTHLVVVLAHCPVSVVHHAAPPTPRPAGGRGGGLTFNSLQQSNEMSFCKVVCLFILVSDLVDATLAVETCGVGVRAVQAAGHPSCPLLLQQLSHDGLHSLRGLEHDNVQGEVFNFMS